MLTRKKLYKGILSVLILAGIAGTVEAVDLTDACVFHYKMNDDADNKVVIDSSGNCNHGTAAQNTGTITTTGQINASLDFDGTTDYINTNSAYQSVFKGTGTDAFTFNAWVQLDDGQGKTSCAFGVDSGGDYVEVWLHNTGTIYILYSANVSYLEMNTSVIFADGYNDWKMITIILKQYDETHVQGKVYVDGDLAEAEVGTQTVIMSGYAGTLFPLIGAHNNNGSVNGKVDGRIDCATLFNRELTDEEIAFLYNSGDGTENLSDESSVWKLNETSGTTAHDSAGVNDGTFNGNDPCWTDGFIGGAVDYNGVKDYFSVPSLDSTYDSDSNFTVIGWFDTNQSTGKQTIVGQWSQSYEAGMEYWGWQMLVESEKIVARFGDELDTHDITGTTDVNVGEWYHFAMVRNGTNVVLYVNGQPKGSGTANFDVYNTKFRIGDGSYKFSGNPTLKGGPFKGIIDDVRVYDRALTAEEVEQLYEKGLSGNASNPSPANPAYNVSVNAELSWTAGERAETHDVYFGTTNPPAYIGEQAGTIYNPGTLCYSTTYYWRVDEKNFVGTTTGDIWSFTTGADPNFINWWKFNDFDSPTAEDSISNDDGTFNGDDPCWVDSESGGAVDLNGVNDYFSVSSLDSAYDSDSVFTVCGWFKTEQSTGQQTIVGQWSNDYGCYNGWQVLVENNKVVARFGNDTCTEDLTGTSIVTDDDLHHFAMVHNGPGSIVLYVDGESEDTGMSQIFIYGTKFRIGDGSYGGGVLKGGPFNGIIDDVRIFNRVLSAGEVWQLYDNGL